jgi:hypothetical protein
MSTSRDLALDANYDLAIVGQDLAPLVADVPSIVSDVEATIRLVTGEWFLDQSQGIPWLSLFQSKQQPLQALRAALFTAISRRLGITQVVSVTISPQPDRRTAKITWSAFSDSTLLGSTVPVSP